MNHAAMSDYMAHGFCFSWEPRLVWLHVGSDILTGIAYYMITAAMGYYAFDRDIAFERKLNSASLKSFHRLVQKNCSSMHYPVYQGPGRIS